MPGVFPARKYTERQREAIRRASEEGIKVPTICKRAERGLLELDGNRLDPFVLSPSTGYDITNKAARKRARQERDLIAIAEPRDTIETLRRRFILSIDAMLDAEERLSPAKRDPERMRRIAGAIREAARIPGPSDERPVEPPSKTTRAGQLGETRSELGQSLLRTGTGIEPVQGETDIHGRPMPLEPEHANGHEPTPDSSEPMPEPEPGSVEAPRSALVAELAPAHTHI
jgi:hypothetical protein